MRNIVWTNNACSVEEQDMEFMIDEFKECAGIDEGYCGDIFDDAVDYCFGYWRLEELRNPHNNNLCGTVKVVADLGRWCGRADGYKYVDDLSDIFDDECDYCTWYFDDENDGILSFYGVHHDGHNFYEYYFVEDEDEDGNETLIPITMEFLEEHGTYLF